MNDVKRVFQIGSSRCPKTTKKDLKLSEFYNPSSIDTFLCYKHKSAFDKNESFRKTSDIYMLFNQQRLDRMTQAALLDHFNNLAQSSPALTALRSKLSDDQLISLVKSRYIQSPSELLNWSRYLNTLADAELQKVVQASQEKQAQQQQKTESVPSSAPVPAAE